MWDITILNAFSQPLWQTEGKDRATLLSKLFSVIQQNCHPDRSVAQWRDLLFLVPKLLGGERALLHHHPRNPRADRAQHLPRYGVGQVRKFPRIDRLRALPPQKHHLI